MSWEFDFSYSLWLNFKAQAVLWRSYCWDLEIWAHGLAQMSWNLKFLFKSSNWSSNQKLFYKGLVAQSLKFESKAWLTWAEILIFFSFFVIELKIWSCFIKVALPRAWNLTSRVGSNEVRFWIFFSFLVVELQTSSCFMKVSLPRAWNLSPRLGSHELKFWFIVFILCDWTSKLKPQRLAQMTLEFDFSYSLWLNFKVQAVLWRSRCGELKIWPQDLA
jgi:hypothetical protein